MRATSSFALAALVALPASAAAQVSAHVVIPEIRIGNVITIGGPHRHVEVVHVRPRGRRVVYVESAPRVIVVERWNSRWHNDRRYVPRVIYYDRRHDRYYDRHRSGLVKVNVFFRGGRYYRDWDARRDGRWDDRRDRRDDRWDDRREGRRDHGRDGRRGRRP